MKIVLIKSYEGNSVGYTRCKTISEAENQLIDWEKQGLCTNSDEIFSFSSIQRAFIFLLKEINKLGGTNHEI